MLMQFVSISHTLQSPSNVITSRNIILRVLCDGFKSLILSCASCLAFTGSFGVFLTFMTKLGAREMNKSGNH